MAYLHNGVSCGRYFVCWCSCKLLSCWRVAIDKSSYAYWLNNEGNVFEEVFRELAKYEQDCSQLTGACVTICGEFYHSLVTQCCVCVCGLTPCGFARLESTLLSAALLESWFCRLLAGDLWSFIARYGSADLCSHHVITMATALSKLGEVEDAGVAVQRLGNLFRRLMTFLGPKKQLDLVCRYRLAGNAVLWQHLPPLNRLHRGTRDAVVRQVVEQLERLECDGAFADDMRLSGHIHAACAILLSGSGGDLIGSLTSTAVSGLTTLMAGTGEGSGLLSVPVLVTRVLGGRLITNKTVAERVFHSDQLQRLSPSGQFLLVTGLSQFLAAYINSNASLPPFLPNLLHRTLRSLAGNADEPFLTYEVKLALSNLTTAAPAATHKVEDLLADLDQCIVGLETTADLTPAQRTTLTQFTDRLLTLLSN